MKQRTLSRQHWIMVLATLAACAWTSLGQQASGNQQPAPAATPAQLKEYPTTQVDTLVREWTRAKNYTREYLDAMPEDGFGFKPTPEVRSFADQMLHLAAANFSFVALALGVENPYKGKDFSKMDEFKTKAAVTKLVMESYDFTVNLIKSAGEVKLNERIAMGGMNRPRLSFIAAGFEHQTHHRGQTTLYLRLKGVTPPQEKLF